MTEYFKQFFDAWGDRIRSPFFGSIAIAFIAVNWKVLFYVFFADRPIRARILYFEANADLVSLVVLPLAIGVSAAIFLPWASFISALLARWPKSLLHNIQFTEATRRRIAEYEKRAEEEGAMASFEAAKETRKINAAKRLEEANSVSSDLKEDLESERRSADTGSVVDIPTSEADLRILLGDKIIAGLSESVDGRGCYDGTIFQFSGTDKTISLNVSGFPMLKSQKRFQMTMAKALENLFSSKYIEILNQDDVGNEYQLTELGYYYADKLVTKSLT